MTQQSPSCQTPLFSFCTLPSKGCLSINFFLYEQYLWYSFRRVYVENELRTELISSSHYIHLPWVSHPGSGAEKGFLSFALIWVYLWASFRAAVPTPHLLHTLSYILQGKWAYSTYIYLCDNLIGFNIRDMADFPRWKIVLEHPYAWIRWLQN